MILNDRLALVLRRGAPGAEVYSVGTGGEALRAVLAPASGSNVAAVSSLSIVENNPGTGAAEAIFSTPGGKRLALRYTLKLGQPVVESEAREGVTGLRVEAPCRFVIMPDFFADDIVIDAAELPGAEAELPSDNFLLHLMPDHQAIVMTVVKTSEEDMRVGLSGQGRNG